MRWVCLLLVWLLALLAFSWRAGERELGSGYIDPIGRIAPQDEAVYTHIALGMVTSGDWLTPRFLGRLALFKPPLLYWCSAASLRLFGGSTWAARLPSLLAASLVAALLFHCIGGWRGAAAALLWTAHPLAYALARVNLTDSLLTLWILLSVIALWRGNRPGYALAVSAAILTKAIAGLIPLLLLGLWWLLSPAGKRPSFRFWTPALLAAAALTLPWFAWQAAAHPRWFKAEFIDFEILGFTLGAPPQTSPESGLWFYGWRLLRTSGPLLLLALLALPKAWRSRREQPLAVLLLAWVAAVALAVAGNGYRNFAYLLPAIPALCWLAARYAPSRAALALTLAALLAIPAQPHPTPPEIAVASGLKRYRALQRTHDLILVDTHDQFLATTMGLPRLRYAFFGRESDYRRYGLDFRELGIVLTPKEWAGDRAHYAARLQQWNNGPEPIGTVILVQSPEDLARLIAGNPQADFVIPEKFRATHRQTHEVREDGRGFLFLLAR
jgi:hypothetical protein